MSVSINSSSIRDEFKEEISEDESMNLEDPNFLLELINQAAELKNALKLETHKCPHCPRGYKILANLTKHLLHHDRSNFKFKCTHCKKKFVTEDKLHHHSRVTHAKTNAGLFDCHICPSVFTNSYYLQTHLKFHNTNPIKCIICNSVTKHKRSFDRHLKEVHQIRDRLRMDYLTDMGDPEKDNSEDDNELERASKRIKFTCEDEDEVNQNQLEYRRLNKIILKATKLRDESEVTGPKQFKCDICFKIYKQSDYLKAHKKMHDGTATKFHCKLCPSTFVIKKQFSAHMSMVHTQKLIQCSICKNLLKHVPSYRRHLKFSHKITRIRQLQELIENRTEVVGSDETVETFAEDDEDLEDSDSKEYENGDIETIEEFFDPNLEQDDGVEIIYIDADFAKLNKINEVKEKQWLECNICDERFSNKSDLDQHVSKHFDNVDRKMAGKLINKKSTIKLGNKLESLDISDLLKNFDCLTCGETFPFEFLLNKHKSKHEEEIVEGTSKDQNKSIEVLKSTSIVDEYCKFCHKIFPFNELKKHLQLCKKEIFKIQKKDQKMMKDGTHIFKHNCPCCDKFFYLKGDLEQHKQLHKHFQNMSIETNKVYSCDHCGLEMTRKRLIKQHVLIHAEPSFECNICQKKFRVESYLKKHLLTHQDRDRNLICSDVSCKKTFFDKMSLVRHMRKHNINDQFACDLCDKTFLRRVALTKHQKLHETNQCPTCLVTFSYYRQLEIHLWANGHKCKAPEKIN